MCDAKRTRWVTTPHGRVASCSSCYNRETYFPEKRKLLKKAKAPDDSDRSVKRAATMLRKGAPWSFVCEKTGLSKRALTLRMGELAATEPY